MTDCNSVPRMTERNVSEKEMVTREEAAQLLRVSVSTIDRYLRDGTIPRVKLGKRLVRIERHSLNALLEGGAAA